MLDEDVAAGFPCAVRPQANQPNATQVIDLHDLHNHPRGLPTLKVCRRLDKLRETIMLLLTGDLYGLVFPASTGSGIRI